MATSLSEVSLGELENRLAARGFKPAHAAPLLRAHYAGGDLPSTEEGPRRLPAGLREAMAEDFPDSGAEIVRRQVADDGTVKLLLRLADGRTVESVLMPDFDPARAAGCVSSQVGC